MNRECSLFLSGERGIIKLGGKALDELEEWDIAGVPLPALSQPERTGNLVGLAPNHLSVYRNAITALSNKNLEDVSGHDARKSLQLVHAIYDSAQTKQVVKLL